MFLFGSTCSGMYFYRVFQAARPSGPISQGFSCWRGPVGSFPGVSRVGAARVEHFDTCTHRHTPVIRKAKVSGLCSANCNRDLLLARSIFNEGFGDLSGNVKSLKSRSTFNEFYFERVYLERDLFLTREWGTCAGIYF